MTKSLILHLYHGTSEQVAKKINQKGFNEVRRPNIGKINTGKVSKKLGSLGWGLYCFEDNELALNFSKKTNQDMARVVAFNFNSDADFILDFQDPTDLKLFNAWINEPKRAKTLSRLRDFYSNRNFQKSLDGAIIEAYIWDSLRRGNMSRIDVVRMLTHTDFSDTLFRDSAIPNGIEVCIRNVDGVEMSSIKIL